MKTKLTKLEKHWILYDIANSAYILLATTIIPVLFNSIASSQNLSDDQYLAYWGYAITAATLIVALLSPILGTISDGKGRKKPLFTIFLTIGVLGTFIQPFIGSWLWFLIVLVITKVGFNGSIVFYDSMLTDITTPERMDDVSSQGYAWGYIGSCIPFIISIGLIMFGPKIGLAMNTIMIIVFAITAVWWGVLSLPLLKNYEQKHYVEAIKNPFTGSFKKLKATLADIAKHKKIKYFLLSFFFYIDGVYTIISMATAYGASLGLDSNGLILALLVTQIVAFPCAIFFGKIAKKFKTESLLKINIIAYALIACYGVFLEKLYQFWILAVAVGGFQGAIQALSRSYYAKIIPPEKSGEYFGIFDIFGKGASITGTLLVSVITSITGKQNIAIMALVILFILGYIFFSLAAKTSKYE